METILIRERYKIVRILYQKQDYMLAEAVDIQDRETPVCLINLYAGSLLHRYGRIYAGLQNGQCAAFQRVFLESDTLAAVFSDARGIPIDQMFFKGDRWRWPERLEYAELLLHAALLLEELPPEIGCAALCSENVLFPAYRRAVELRFAVPPMGEMNRRELALLAGDHLRKMLPGGLKAPDEEIALLKKLQSCPSMISLYSAWREARGKIQTGYEEWEKKNWFKKGLTLLKRAVKRRREK